MADAREVAGRFVQAFNAHDESRIRELNAEEAVFEAPGDVHLEGREAVTQYAMTTPRPEPNESATPESRGRVREPYAFDALLRTPTSAAEIRTRHIRLRQRPPAAV
jgi:SnoaL-like domain